MIGIYTFLCASLLLFQTISGQAIGHGIYPNNYANAVAAEAAYANLPYTPAAELAFANNLPYAPASEVAFANNLPYTPAAEVAFANNLPYAPAAEVAFANNLPYTPIAEALANNLAYPAAAVAEIPEIARTFNGGGLKVTSFSPIAPTGVTIESDNLLFEGPLAVSGQLPFAGVVALEGPLPAIGQGAVSYSCSDGNVGIVSEKIEPVGPLYPNGRVGPTEIPIARVEHPAY